MIDKYEAQCVVAMAEVLKKIYEEAAERRLDDWMRSALVHYRMTRIMGFEEQRVFWEHSAKGDANEPAMMQASSPTSGDRTEPAPRTPDVEPIVKAGEDNG